MDDTRILVIEDSPALAVLLKKGLSEEGFEVEVAPNGEVAMRSLGRSWDLVILDLMLPDVAGEEILNFLSQQVDHPRVLVLSARANTNDKIELFRLGCDDYVTKPFVFEELLGRVRALLRRSSRPAPENIEYEDLALDPPTHKLRRGSREVTLTPKEFAIARLLMNTPGKVVSRKEVLRSVWGLTHEQNTNSLEVHLVNLRKKLHQLDRQEWLQTVRANGLTFSKPEEHGA